MNLTTQMNLEDVIITQEDLSDMKPVKFHDYCKFEYQFCDVCNNIKKMHNFVDKKKKIRFNVCKRCIGIIDTYMVFKKGLA